MPEFFTVLSPADALAKLWAHLPFAPRVETIATAEALGRVTAEIIAAPEALPAFPRSTMDGYAVRAQDTFGASATLPAYLNLIGDIHVVQKQRDECPEDFVDIEGRKHLVRCYDSVEQLTEAISG